MKHVVERDVALRNHLEDDGVSLVIECNIQIAEENVITVEPTTASVSVGNKKSIWRHFTERVLKLWKSPFPVKKSKTLKCKTI